MNSMEHSKHHVDCDVVPLSLSIVQLRNPMLLAGTGRAKTARTIKTKNILGGNK